jgi:predicted RNase H-like HicB family nuclease
MKITVVLEQTKNNWGAYTPDDIGSVIATGKTREETIENFRSALHFHLEGLRETGLAAPDVTELELRELVLP